jgi:hypothetical protein
VWRPGPARRGLECRRRQADPGLDRKSAGRVLVATIAANVDDIGSTTSTPWRVMSWEIRQDVAPHLVDGEISAMRADLEDGLTLIDQLRARLEAALSKLT